MARNCSAAVPPDMSFTFSILSIVATYAVVFGIAFIGNFTMFLILCRNQLVKVRRVHSLLLHMNIAHLMVTLLYMPKEILHNYLIAWNGGDLLCRVCKFFDVFGISLSANILICISLDRFYSIFFPLYAMRARRSVNHMVAIAWLVSFLTSAPQFYLFRTASHPCYPWYTQCVARDFIGEVSTNVVFYFSILNIVQVYFLPLVVTLLCYSLILFRISSGARGSGEHKKKNEKGGAGGLLRRSTAGNLEKARSRTLRMTFIIVLAFLCCWTPYAIVMFLHFTTNIQWMPKEIRKLIYAFAVFNSAITPYLYGYFSFDVKKELKLLTQCSKASVSERNLSQSAAVQSTARSLLCRHPSTSVSERVRRRSASANNFERDLSSNDLRVNNGLSHGRGNSMKMPKRSTCTPAVRETAASLTVSSHTVYKDKDYV